MNASQSSNLCVEYHGALLAGTGYAEAARNAVLALHGAGVEVKADPSGFGQARISVGKGVITGYRYEENRALQLPGDFKRLVNDLRMKELPPGTPLIAHAPSVRFDRFVEPGRRTIGYTAWETGRMPDHWVDGCNAVDEVWIPCTHNLRALRASGVTKPIYVIPHCIDIERFKPSALRLNPTFTFLSVFRWGKRKGWADLFIAYERAFTSDDPVILRVLTNFTSDEHAAEAAAIQSHFANEPGKPRVEILPLEYVTYDWLPVLYQNADVFVLPSHGEGFCLPCAEAMASGLPAIVTNATAFTDYVDSVNGYPIPCEEGLAETVEDPDRHATAWAVADNDALVSLMLRAFHDQGEVARKGILARQTIMDKFGFGPVANLMIERLAANG